ncbi:hypothetical protein PUN28_012176 [Cardiocondyla obscurior]|uniref:Uncharacterized protein n=1 Tax=Cardiocondyla obscurior TaxID=286306 RepID=A0AAW2FDT8_9HYME
MHSTPAGLLPRCLNKLCSLSAFFINETSDKNDSVAVTDPVVAQRLFIVHQRQPVEGDDDLVGRHAALDLAERLEVLQLQLLAHVEDEHAVVAERRHRHSHRAGSNSARFPLFAGARGDARAPPRSLAVDGKVRCEKRLTKCRRARRGKKKKKIK